MKKLLTILLAAVIGITSFAVVGCGGRDDGTEAIDPNKSQLNVGVFNAGYGRVWADKAADDFEKLYANTSFEPGKMGVQVIVDAKKEEFKPSLLESTMETYENAIYYTNQHNYTNYMAKGLLTDITTVINQAVYDADGNLALMDDGTGKLVPINGAGTATKSMMDRVDSNVKDLYKIESGANAGKYFMTPWAGLIGAMIYDADLFSREGFFFNEDGEIDDSLTLEDVENGLAGPGPDGKVGTADDGMPETYKDFLTLLDTISKATIDPFTWSGQTGYQRWYAFESVYANYQGYNEFNKMYDGVTPNSELAEQYGRKAAIQFFYDVTNLGYYASASFSQSYDAAQRLFVRSMESPRPVAMFMEGVYWENEVRDTFGTMAEENADPSLDYGQRNFKLLPIPNFVNVNGIPNQTNTSESEVLCGYGANASAFITAKNTCANPQLQKHLAELFLQFTNSREQLVKLMQNTGGCIGLYDFEFEEGEELLLTKYGRDIYKYIEQGSKIVWDLSGSEEIRNKKTFYYVQGNTIYRDVPALVKNAPSEPVLTVDAIYEKVANYVRDMG